MYLLSGSERYLAGREEPRLAGQLEFFDELSNGKTRLYLIVSSILFEEWIAVFAACV